MGGWRRRPEIERLGSTRLAEINRLFGEVGGSHDALGGTVLADEQDGAGRIDDDHRVRRGIENAPD